MKELIRIYRIKIKGIEVTLKTPELHHPEYIKTLKIRLSCYKAFLLDLVSSYTELPPTDWVTYNFEVIESRPPEYGKYLICRKDGKIHWETWNGSGWAYNNNEIRYWARISPPN